MSQDWNFESPGTAVATPTGPKPTPKRFRRLLHNEEAYLETLPPPAEPEPTPNANGRDSQGRFTKGNKGGTGNPFARQTAALRKVVVNALTPERLAKITEAMMVKAENGDVAAAKLLYTYGLGKPAPAPDPDRLDLEDFQILRERLSPQEADWHLIRKMTPVEGIISAGHRVADARAEAWRHEVEGPEPIPEPTQEEQDAMLREGLALARVDAEQKGPAQEKAEKVQAYLIKMHKAGAMHHMMRKIGVDSVAQLVQRVALMVDREARQAQPPSANGPDGDPAPSANGGNGRPAPSTNGSDGRYEPSVNGKNGG